MIKPFDLHGLQTYDLQSRPSKVFIEELARHARAKLVLVGRTTFPPREEWQGVVAARGEQDALSRKLAKLMAIEAAGGELVKDGSRHRSAGGVLVQLVKQTATAEEKRACFRDGSNCNSARTMVSSTPTPRIWSKRGSLPRPALPMRCRSSSVGIPSTPKVTRCNGYEYRWSMSNSSSPPCASRSSKGNVPEPPR